MPDVELTAAQVRQLQAVKGAIEALKGQVTRAERAGLNVAELKQKLSDTERVRDGLLREFTPGLNRR